MTIADTTTDPYPQVARELALLLRRARSLATTMSKRAHPVLDATMYPMLAHIARTPEVHGCDLAAQFGVGRATISRQVSHLESLGLVSRHPDPQDARGQLIELTPEGDVLVTNASEAWRLRLSEALSDWSPDDVAILATSLGRLNETIDESLRTP